jgi:predicted MFS family arabinose efflux permease
VDIRTPIGGLFVIVGALLVCYGLATAGSPVYERSLGINVNLWWGLVLAVFGAVMFWLGRRKPGPA